MDIDELHSQQGFILDFKGTPSQEVNKTGFSVFTTFELALSGGIGIAIMYSCIYNCGCKLLLTCFFLRRMDRVMLIIIKILWRACNLTSFSPCLTGPVDYLFASCHKGPRFKCPGGYLCETGILLLALSRYIGDPDVIDHHCGLV
jgi:hypothetical protein